MSYARFGCDDSDVYVFLSCTGSLECCACAMGAMEDGDLFPESFSAITTDEMLAHLAKHREAGHTVPDDTIERLAEESDENDAWLAGDEAQAERAKIAVAIRERQADA